MSAFTFYDLLGRNLPDRADHPMLIDGDRQLTYANVAREVEAVAAWLAGAGIRRGDRVCVNLRKSVEEVVAMFAAGRIGAVFVNVNYQWTVSQLDYVVRDSGSSALFVDERMAAKVNTIRLPESLRSIIVKGTCPDHAKMIAWDRIPRSNIAPDPVGIDMDLGAILYTSGSTGSPKGVMLSHLNMIQGARSVSQYLQSTPEDRILSLLPFSFDYGLSQLTTMCLVGGTVILYPLMMAAEVVRRLVADRVTGLAAVPPAWVPIVLLLAEKPVDLPDLRYITNSGGKIPQTILQLMPQVFPKTKIYLMYGLTEAFRSTYLPPDRFLQKMGSIGKAIPNVETYIVDPEIGVCGPGQQGELVHRGSLISKGYWGRPEDTAEKIKPCPELRHLIGDEKVVYSGDIVRIDEDGYYWFVGRRDGMIKASGFRISPDEVEDIVFRSGLVDEVVAFGVADEVLGQCVEIVVTGRNRQPLDGADLMRYCRREMPHYMVPRRIHHWDGEFPRTGSGKIDRPRVVCTCATPEVAGDDAIDNATPNSPVCR